MFWPRFPSLQYTSSESDKQEKESYVHSAVSETPQSMSSIPGLGCCVCSNGAMRTYGLHEETPSITVQLGIHRSASAFIAAMTYPLKMSLVYNILWVILLHLLKHSTNLITHAIRTKTCTDLPLQTSAHCSVNPGIVVPPISGPPLVYCKRSDQGVLLAECITHWQDIDSACIYLEEAISLIRQRTT